MEKNLNKQLRKLNTKCYEEFNKNPFNSEVEFKITRKEEYPYESFKTLLDKKVGTLEKILSYYDSDFTVNCDAWSATDADGKALEWAITVEWEGISNPFTLSDYPWRQSFQEYEKEQEQE